MEFSHKHYFVTGTDTGIGKTYVTRQLMQHLKSQGKTVLGLKPIACGTQTHTHEDALIYQQENSLALPYDEINPYLFKEPISPHIASRLENQHLTSAQIVARMQGSLGQDVDHVFIEGAGGICVPINQDETLLDVMRALNVPIILVVGLRLGCLNHALMSVEVLKSAGLTIAGWVANPIDAQMMYRKENVQTLREKLDPIVELSYSVSL